jgi:hypothetical protein
MGSGTSTNAPRSPHSRKHWRTRPRESGGILNEEARRGPASLGVRCSTQPHVSAAATKFLQENQHLRSIGDYALHLKQLDPYLGDLPLASVHMGTLRPFIEARRSKAQDQVNQSCARLVRHILKLAASEWLDENNLTWLARAAQDQAAAGDGRAEPYPVVGRAGAVVSAVAEALARMALFKVNTGCRDAEVCGLKWAWEVPVPELNTSVFPDPRFEGQERGRAAGGAEPVAKSVIDSVRGEHDEYVFVVPRSTDRTPCTTPAGRKRASARASRRCVCMISSTRSGGDCVQRACRSRIGRICSVTAPDASPRTTRPRSWRT